MSASASAPPSPVQRVEKAADNALTETQDEVRELAREDADSTDSSVRYMAYAQRLKTAARAASRYTAYTSDIGEAFRPVVSPMVVRAAYGISWLYLVGDVSYETYKASVRGPSPLEAATGFSENTRLGMIAVKRSVFQSIASMALPAFTIHTAVRYATRAFKDVKNPRIRGWGPTVTGLAIVPFLPYLFDEPVEHVVDKVFERVEEAIKPAGVSVPAVEGKREL